MHSDHNETNHLHITPEALQKLMNEQTERLAQRTKELTTEEECLACEQRVPLKATRTDEVMTQLVDATPDELIIHVDDIDASVWDQPVRNDRAARRSRARGKTPK